MKIKLIVVGKLKEDYLKKGIAEYQKRLGRFAKIEVIELKDEKIPEKASLAENQSIIEKEGKRILTKIGERDYVLSLAIEGEMISSEVFSQRIDRAMSDGFSTIAFIIGGSLGLSDTVKKKSHLLVSFGQLTFPHQLMRLMLMEQVYRAFMIKEGSAYHK